MGFNNSIIRHSQSFSSPRFGECRFNRPVTGRLHASSQRKQSQTGRKYRRNGRVGENEKQRGSSSTSKVYAKRERTADFLLKEASVKSDSEASEIGMQLLGRLKDNSCHPEALGRLRVGGNVVNVNGFRGRDSAGAKSLAIDNRVGLAGANAVGIDAVGKEPEKGKTRLRMRHVDGVGVGKQDEAVVLRKFLQERL